jgi:hypothetical protein
MWCKGINKNEMRTFSIDSQPCEDVLNHPSPSMLNLEVMPPNLHAGSIIGPPVLLGIVMDLCANHALLS